MVGAVVVTALAVLVWQPQPTLPLLVAFGMSGSELVLAVLAVLASALPLAVADGPTTINGPAGSCSSAAT